MRAGKRVSPSASIPKACRKEDAESAAVEPASAIRRTDLPSTTSGMRMSSEGRSVGDGTGMRPTAAACMEKPVAAATNVKSIPTFITPARRFFSFK